MANTFAANSGFQDEVAFTEGNLVMADLNSEDVREEDFTEIGSITEFSFSNTFTETNVKETRTGKGNITNSIITDNETTLTITMKSITAYNLNLALLGSSTAQVVTSQTKTKTLKANFVYDLGDQLIDASSIVIVDTATGAVTYVENVNYVVDGSGLIKILTEAQQTANGADDIIAAAGVECEIAFSSIDSTKIQAFTQNSIKKYCVFGGINKVDGKFYKVIVPKLSLQPSDGIGFISPDAETLITVTAKALTSPAYPAASPYSIIK